MEAVTVAPDVFDLHSAFSQSWGDAACTAPFVFDPVPALQTAGPLHMQNGFSQPVRFAIGLATLMYGDSVMTAARRVMQRVRIPANS